MKIFWLRPPGISRAKWMTLAIVAFVIIGLHLVIQAEQYFFESSVPDFDFLTESLASWRTEMPKQFPSGKRLLIERVVHQTWHNTFIPNSQVSLVKSWTGNHPHWEYWFWTDESARGLIADKYPEYLSMFDLYTEGIRKADALRYFVLYEYGGVYADLDMESLKSLDPVIRQYSCFLGQEPYEHPVMDSNFERLAINALMGCRKKHPFMKFVIENLPNFFHMWNVLDSTGPHFLTWVYHSYTKSLSDPTHKDTVYLVPPDYFFPTLDPWKYFDFTRKCKRFTKLNLLQKKACVSLKKNGLRRSPLPHSFTVHHWRHTYLYQQLRFWEGTTDIKDVVKHVQIYGRQG